MESTTRISMTSAGPKAYTADQIEVVEGLEGVRRRPSMYIGGTDTRGLHHLLWEILDNSVDEHLAGACTEIHITLHKDGCSCTITDNGRGIPVDVHPKTKVSTLETVLTVLHAGGKFSNQAYLRSGGLNGVGSSVVNALSSKLVATVHRDGHEWQQTFRRGKPVGPIEKVRPFRGHGTSIFFRPDEQIFTKTALHPDTIKQHLEAMAYIHAGLKLIFEDEAKKEKLEYCFPDGLKAYLAKVLAEDQRKPIHDQDFAISRDDGTYKIEAILRWTESTDEHIRSHVNGIRTHAGGTHEAGLRSAVLKAIRNYIEVHDIKIKGVTLESSDIREGIVAIVSVFLSEPLFQGQTKEKLNTPEMAGAVEGLVRPALESWLNSNPTVADAIVGRIVLAARARQASREASAEVRRKTATRKSNLPAKLKDCRSKDPRECELFIVEGDSAGGSAAMGRDCQTQAVLPLRGKILNTESLTVGKLLENAEIKDLVESLGTGIGPNFDLRGLRYDRIVLMMDADSDGYHISTLLLGFFFRHMRDLIANHKLYLAQPPLYGIRVGAEIRYAQDDAHKEEILSSLPANRKVEILRFKGLGEMTPTQLKETTMDASKRTLLAVTMESVVDADRTFNQLLGKDAAERYRLIMDDAKLVDDLDV